MEAVEREKENLTLQNIELMSANPILSNSVTKEIEKCETASLGKEEANLHELANMQSLVQTTLNEMKQY